MDYILSAALRAIWVSAEALARAGAFFNRRLISTGPVSKRWSGRFRKRWWTERAKPVSRFAYTS